MPTIYREVEQNSEQWDLLRRNRITASVLGVIVGGSLKAWARLMEDVKYGRMSSGRIRSMDWGHKQEPAARAFYELETGNVVERVGFATHSDYPFVGASPDGIVGSDGGLEIKCPYNATNHLATIAGGMPPRHVPQVQGNIWVMEADWWDFVSFDPRQPAATKLYIERTYRDEKYIAAMRDKVLRFWDMLCSGKVPGGTPTELPERRSSGRFD